jgi:hypothetical protein
MSRSIDDRVFGFTMKDANWNVIGYAVWDRVSDKATSFLTTNVNEVQVDKSGAYLYVTTNDQGATAIQQKVITVATGASVDLTRWRAGLCRESLRHWTRHGHWRGQLE